MERDLISCLNNYSPNYSKISGPLELEEIKTFSLKYFNLRVYSMNEEDAIEGGGLLIRPKLICLKPFCIVYCSKDSFYSVLQSADSLVLYLSPEVSLIADFGKLSLGLQQVWNETIRYGIKFLSLSNEQLIDNRKIYRVIHEKSIEDGNSDKKVYHLI